MCDETKKTVYIVTKTSADYERTSFIFGTYESEEMAYKAAFKEALCDMFRDITRYYDFDFTDYEKCTSWEEAFHILPSYEDEEFYYDVESSIICNEKAGKIQTRQSLLFDIIGDSRVGV